MTHDTSGRALRVPLAHYDPASSRWRTSQGMFPSDWPTSSQTCPRWGMTRRGELFELPTPALPTVAPASSSLPTPRATRGGSSTETMYALGGERTDGQRPRGGVLLPTPRTSDTNGVGEHGTGGPDLRTAVSLLPKATNNENDLLAPVEAEVQRLSEAFIASEAEVARLRESVTDHHNRELSALRTVERQMVERDEAVAAERRRIAELEALVAEGIEAFRLTKEYLNVPDDQGWVLLPDVAGWSHFDWTTKAAAWIAEGETSTIRDVDPGNAQDARRIAEEDDA